MKITMKQAKEWWEANWFKRCEVKGLHALACGCKWCELEDDEKLLILNHIS